MKQQPISVKQLIRQYANDPLGLLKALDGYYECPKDETGKRLGPLVAYAAKYKIPGSDVEKHYVGDVYANFAKAEMFPMVMYHLATGLLEKILPLINPEKHTVVVGPQMGGVAIAQMLALRAETYGLDVSYACAEKKVAAKAANETSREEETLILGRHDVPEGSDAIIVEDVMNNFFTTGKTINLIENYGGTVVGISGLLNRSPEIEDVFKYEEQKIPVRALVRRAFPEYKQHDSEVAADIAAGNLVIKAKNEWPRLMEAMDKAAQTAAV